MTLWAMELLASLFLYTWLFCVGASVGSFLNVVVYRLPRRKNLAYPGSRCPRCGHAIRLWDNIPIFSWLALGGRCRDCQSPIPTRYFLVELAVATLFLLVALIETKLTGNFPRRDWDAGRWLISPYETLPFWSAYALHVVLLTTLLGAALIDADGFRTPRRMFLPVIGLAIALQWLRPAGRDLFGVLAGVALGALVWGAWRMTTGNRPRFAPVMLFAAVSAVAGLRGGLEIAALSAVLFAVAVAGLRVFRANAIIPLAGLVLIVALPRIVDLDLRLSLPLVWPLAWQGWIAGGGVLTVILAALAAGLLAPPQYFAPPPADPPEVELASPPTDSLDRLNDSSEHLPAPPEESTSHEPPA